MYSYTMAQWLFFFYFYCFFGWCFESSYVSLKKKAAGEPGVYTGSLFAFIWERGSDDAAGIHAFPA